MNSTALASRKLRRCGAWFAVMAWSVGLDFGSAALGCTALEIRKDGAAILLRWPAQAGWKYRVESSPAPSGPWIARGEVTPNATSGTWSEPNGADAPGRFYRLALVDPPQCDGAPGNPPAIEAALLPADTIPRTLPVWYESSRQVVVEGAFLASQLGAFGQQLVTIGTLTQVGQQWSYSATPTDRLVVQFHNDRPTEYVIQEMQGDFSLNAANFLNQNHALRWTVKRADVGDLACVSSRQGRLIHGTARGRYLFQGIAYEADLTANIDHFFESSFGGSQTITDSRLTGILAADGFNLAVDQRVRFEIVVQGGQSASTTEEWLAHLLKLGTDTYSWHDVKKQKSFRNGVPSRADEYWLAQGTIRKNGVPFGTYRKSYRDFSGALAQIKFEVRTPDATVEIESWDVRPPP